MRFRKSDTVVPWMIWVVLTGQQGWDRAPCATLKTFITSFTHTTASSDCEHYCLGSSAKMPHRFLPPPSLPHPSPWPPPPPLPPSSPPPPPRPPPPPHEPGRVKSLRDAGARAWQEHVRVTDVAHREEQRRRARSRAATASSSSSKRAGQLAIVLHDPIGRSGRASALALAALAHRELVVDA